MANEEIRILVEEELEPVNILIDETGHGVGASISDHRDVTSEAPSDGQALVYNQTQQKYINKLIEGVLEYDDDYDCFIVP